MARKKKQPTDPPPDNVDNSDDTFGLPEVEYQPLKRDEPEEVEEPPKVDEPPNIEEPVTPDEPVESDAPDVVVINEYDDSEQVTEPPPSDTPGFQFDDESAHEEPHKESIFSQEHTFEADHQPYQPTYSYREEPEMWPKVLGVLLVLLLIGIGIWYFAFHRPEQLAKEEQERKELLAIQEEARKKDEERRAAARRAEEERAAAATPIVATPAIGEIETLSGRSGRYYVVVASSIDGDLIMDYAKKLSARGVSAKIIPPFGKSAFHRLAVAEGDTYDETQASADGMKGGDYGDKIWVVKY
jgi:hypothetical protein